MCDMCGSQEEVQAAVNRNLGHASEISKLAQKYEDIAYRKIKPHTRDMKEIGCLARNIIKILADEWL